MTALTLFLGVFLLLPVFTVIQVGCDWGLIVEAFRSQVYLEGLLNSLKIAVVTTILVALISLPLALIYDRFDFPGKEFCSLAMLVPMNLPPFVGALGFQQLLGHYGVFNSILAALGFERMDFLGGSGTLRGFPYREVSPVDSNDREIGGQSMSAFTFEVSHPIWNFIRGAVFADAGGVSKDVFDFGFNHFNIGVGYGLRLKMPMVPVPIKLDLAYPILNNQDNVKSRLRFHFNMGFSF
jgi:hypothetical protein